MKLKRILAVAMATTMVMAMSMTAFADEPVTSGTSDGAGTPEGHVEKSLVNVVLPTVPAGTFNYTMDPERLIQVTSAGKYAEGTVFPDADDDTGVYFLVGEKTYANASNEMQVINKSSDPVKVDVKVKVTASAGGKDIPLATAALGDSETAAKLYLAAVIGEGDGAETKILKTDEQTVSKKLAGNPNNFEIVVKDVSETDTPSLAYVYQQKTSGLTPWKALKFSVNGAVTKDLPIASDTTAPKITLTWSYAAVGDVTDEAGVGTVTEGPSITSGVTTIASPGTDGAKYAATLVNGTATNIVFNLPTGNTISKVYANGNPANLTTENSAIVTASGSTVTLKGDSTWANAAAGTVKYIKVVVSTGTDTTEEFIIKITCNPS